MGSLGGINIFAEQIQDVATKNSIVHSIMELSLRIWPKGNRYMPGIAAVNIVYQGTIACNVCRELLVKMYCNEKYGIDRTWLD